MFSDFRFALRQFAKSPGFAAIAVITLALGIGACTAIFSVIDSVVLRPLPFRQPEQLVQIWDHRPDGSDIFAAGLAFKYWRDENTKLASIAVGDPVFRTFTGGGSPERIKGLGVSASYLRVLGVTPLHGNDFAPNADQRGSAQNVLILSHELWQTRFGGDPSIINRTILLDQTPYVVAGVLAPSSLPRNDVLFLEPLAIEDAPWRMSPRTPWATILARLKPGVTVSEAQAELSAIRRSHAGEFPVESRETVASVIPLRDQLTDGSRPAITMLMAAGTLVLVIACANVGNLLLARANARTKEMAVRAALGAGTRRIIRQVLTENIALALLGGVVAVIFALFTVELLGGAAFAIDPAVGRTGPSLNLKLTGGDLPAMLQPRVDWVVLGFAFVVALATGVVCGLFPAMRAARADVNRDLKDGGHGSTAGGRSQAQSLLVAVEIALTVALLIGAGLFLRSFAHITAVDPGFNPREAVYFDLSLPKTTYPEDKDVVRVEQEIVRRLSELPGIIAVGASTNVPFGPTAWGGGITRTDQPDTYASGGATDFIEGEYFRAMGIALHRGRQFTRRDNDPAAPRVAIINEVLVRQLFPDRDPIGQRVTTGGKDWEVVGIVGEVRNRSLEGPARGALFAPHAFNPGQVSVVVRSSLPLVTLQEVLAKTVRAVDPDQPVAVRLLTSGIQQSLRGRESMLALVNAFAAVALLLACLGIYGVMAYTVGQRRRELGIRMALGASQPNVLALILKDGMRLVLFGLGAGVIAAVTGGRLITSMLVGVSAYDPAVIGIVVVTLGAVALAACWIPARRAARIDPIQSLRGE